MVKVPADPLIAHRTFPGGGRKGQQRDPLIVISGHVPQGLTDLRQISQVVMLGHQLAVMPLFGALYHTHSDLVEVQNCGGCLSEIVDSPVYRITDGMSSSHHNIIIHPEAS